MKFLKTLVILLVAAFALAGQQSYAQDGAVLKQADGYLSSLPKDFNTITNKALKAKIDSGESIVLLDVRETAEFAEERIKDAVNIPIRDIAKKVNELPKNKSAQIVVICKSGIRAAYGTMALYMLGYNNVKDLVGGMLAWNTDKLPVVK